MAELLIEEMAESCVVTRARVVSRVLTGIYDEALRDFGINAPQFILLVIIARMGPITRAAIGRFNHQERSTLTRNLEVMRDNGWIDEVVDPSAGRGRPVAVSEAGAALLRDVEPAWRDSQAKARALLGASATDALMATGNRLLEAADSD